MKYRWSVLGLLICLLALVSNPVAQAAPTLPDMVFPPSDPVKLVFIHHSTGGNWLADPNQSQPYGGLGRALMENNYYVSATNYGWGPEGIGDRTDIPNWPEWFLGPNREQVLDALYSASGQNVGGFGDWSRLGREPDGENQIVMFKSCFPNSDLAGALDDPPLAAPNDTDYTVANAKAVYIALLGYFRIRPDKLFVVITAPPLAPEETTLERARNARAFNTWLVDEWLRDYPYANVAVFDYYNVLTGVDNHHRWNGSEIEHVQGTPSNVSAYPSSDSHPATEGHRKATAEFVPLLNAYYHRWKAGAALAAATPTAVGDSVGADQEGAEPVDKGEPEMGMASFGFNMIDDFEFGVNWVPDGDEGVRLTCTASREAHAGESAMAIRYEISNEASGGCWRYFDEVQDWSAYRGLAFWLRGDDAGQRVTLTLFAGNPDAPTPYETRFGMTSDWDLVVLAWEDFALAAWADAGSQDTLNPARIVSMGFSPDPGEGVIGVDELTFFDSEVLSVGPTALASTAAPPATAARTPELASTEVVSAQEVGVAAPEPERGRPEGGLLGRACTLAPVVLLVVVLGLVARRRIGPGSRS